MMNSSTKNFLPVILAIYINLFLLTIHAQAGNTATIVDLQGSTIALTKVITSAITIKSGESEQIVPLKSIQQMTMKEKPGTFAIKLASGKKITAQSTSTIQGTWELGEYKITLSKMKSLTMGETSEASTWKKPKGYMAEVTDTKGSVTNIYDFAFKYTYSYTRSNCMYNCGASSSTTLMSLPVNKGKGALMIPYTKIVSVTAISATGKYPVEYHGTITLISGETMDSDFGFFGSERLETIKGKTELGDYSLSLKKVKAIRFKHKQNVKPLPPYNKWGKTGSLTATLTCQDGVKTDLTSVFSYSPRDNGSVGKYSGSETVQIQIGEAQNDIILNKISAMTITPKKENEYSSIYPLVLKTKKGNTVNAMLEDNRYIGGYNKNDFFYYVKYKDLKQLSVK